MNKIKIGYKEYNCSNIVYYHIQGLDSKSRYLKNEVSTKDKEIERLNGIIQMKQERIDKLNKKVIRRDNIIKEVREYCENNKEFTQRLEDILEILDKVSDK